MKEFDCTIAFCEYYVERRAGINIIIVKGIFQFNASNTLISSQFIMRVGCIKLKYTFHYNDVDPRASLHTVFTTIDWTVKLFHMF